MGLPYMPTLTPQTTPYRTLVLVRPLRIGRMMTSTDPAPPGDQVFLERAISATCESNKATK